MENNLSIWNNLNRPPPSALREIRAGRLKGKSDINPLWRVQALTEQFGPCGVGWKFCLVRMWLEDGSEGQVFAFAQVSLYIANPDSPSGAFEWSEPIPGIGGSMLIAKEKAGLYSNDEAYKMAVTDALGTAAKMIGVAADVYLGLWDGSKYIDKPSPQKQPAKQPAKKKPVVTPIDPNDPATEAQIKKINTMITNDILERIKVKLVLKVSSLKDLTKDRASNLIEKWDEFKGVYYAQEAKQ